ncbi:hypothetical protein NL676_029753 [Syzygium grande]|nr:hypothetical protein NL676_029753 [Syzygium grande]
METGEESTRDRKGKRGHDSAAKKSLAEGRLKTRSFSTRQALPPGSNEISNQLSKSFKRLPVPSSASKNRRENGLWGMLCFLMRSKETEEEAEEEEEEVGSSRSRNGFP